MQAKQTSNKLTTYMFATDYIKYSEKTQQKTLLNYNISPNFEIGKL
jgi:hypothetical protein